MQVRATPPVPAPVPQALSVSSGSLGSASQGHILSRLMAGMAGVMGCGLPWVICTLAKTSDPSSRVWRLVLRVVQPEPGG